MSAARSRRANDKHNHLQRTPILVMGCSLLIACCIAFGGTNWTASAQPSEDQLPEQVAILEGYLPEQVEGEALMALIDEVVAETGATTKKDMGRVMGALTQRTGGNFDKAAAAATLNQRLS